MLRFSVAFFRAGIKEQKTASGKIIPRRKKAKTTPLRLRIGNAFSQKRRKECLYGCILRAGMPCGKGGEGGSGQEIFERFFEKAAQAIVCQTGIIRTSLRAILFGAFAQPKLANMYNIAYVPPVQNHTKISCSEVRAVPRQPIFG